MMYEISITLKDDSVTNRYYFRNRDEMYDKGFSDKISDMLSGMMVSSLVSVGVVCAYELDDGTYLTCRRMK